MEKAQIQELYGLRTMVDDLNAEVSRLQTTLGRMHVSDLNSLKRAYKSLVQHCGALDLESKGMEENIRGLATDIITPEDVSYGLMVTGGVAGGLLAFSRLARLAAFDVPRLPKQLWWMGAAWLGIKLLSGAFKRVHTLVAENRRRKLHLLEEWKSLRERIEIMNALTSWAPPSPPAAAPTLVPLQPVAARGAPGVDGWARTGLEADVLASQSRSAVAAAKIEEELARRHVPLL